MTVFEGKIIVLQESGKVKAMKLSARLRQGRAAPLTNEMRPISTPCDKCLNPDVKPNAREVNIIIP
jgi:hypothetical protein